jgi:hypothetical protein
VPWLGDGCGVDACNESCAGPIGLMVVVANGIASNPITLYGSVWVDFNYTGAIQDGTFPFP